MSRPERASKQVFLTPHDILRILKVDTIIVKADVSWHASERVEDNFGKCLSISLYPELQLIHPIWNHQTGLFKYTVSMWIFWGACGVDSSLRLQTISKKPPGWSSNSNGNVLTNLTLLLFWYMKNHPCCILARNIARRWFERFSIFTPIPGEDSHFDEYVSKGLVQPPTR